MILTAKDVIAELSQYPSTYYLISQFKRYLLDHSNKLPYSIKVKCIHQAPATIHYFLKTDHLFAKTVYDRLDTFKPYLTTTTFKIIRKQERYIAERNLEKYLVFSQYKQDVKDHVIRTRTEVELAFLLEHIQIPDDFRTLVALVR